MSRAVRVGVLGCGAIASAVHLRVLRRARGAALVGAAEPDPAARERARRIARVPVAERPEELLARPDVDAVVVCAPSALHAELAVAAAEAGKHLYLEKPIATTEEDGVRVVAAAEEAGVIAVVGFNRRVHPLFEQARRLVEEGRLGRVRAVHSTFCEPIVEEMPTWKRHRSSGGGVLLDLASHHVDLLRWLLRDEIDAVSATVASEAVADDTAWLHASLAGGAEAHSFFSFGSGRADVIELVGERGVLRIDRYLPPLRLTAARPGLPAVRERRLAPAPTTAAWRLRTLLRRGGDPSFARSLQAFVDLLHGAPNRLATLRDGLRSLEAVLAAEESARSGEPVALEGR